MPVDERARHALYVELEHALGPDEAPTLMEHLPPVGWADVATKADLAALGADLHGEMSELRGDLRSEIASAVRTMVMANIVSVATVGGLAFGAAQLT